MNLAPQGCNAIRSPPNPVEQATARKAPFRKAHRIKEVCACWLKLTAAGLKRKAKAGHFGLILREHFQPKRLFVRA
jgi:hypothetical protein